MREKGATPEHRAAEASPEVAPGARRERFPLARLDLLRDAVILRGLDDGRVEFWNAGAEALYGWSTHEAMGQALDRLLKTVYPVPRSEIEAEVLRSGSWEGELVHARRDGEEVLVASRWALERGRRGQPTRIVQVDTDGTARRRAEDAVRTLALAVHALNEAPPEREHVLASVAAIVAQGLHGTCVVWLLEPDAQVLAAGAAATPDGSAASELREALALAPPSATSGQHALVLSSGETLLLRPPGPAAQRILSGQPGRAAPAEVGSFLLARLRARGRVLGTLGTWRAPGEAPHSEHDRLLLSYLAADAALAIDNVCLYADAQEAIRIRDEVLNSVVHDLRGPLMTIVAESKLLERWATRPRVDRERVHRGVRRIENSATRISGWIEELLDVARLEQGQPLTLRRSLVNLHELFEQAVSDHQGSTADHTVTLEVGPDTTQLVGLFDGSRLRRVLDNLLGNAIKYSPSGGVVTCRLEHVARDDAAWARLSVSDQGLGIPASDQPHIFSRFHRGANVVGRIEGTGIGLARAYQVVRQHGGEIELDSREGQGTTFCVWLPLSSASRGRHRPHDS